MAFVCSCDNYNDGHNDLIKPGFFVQSYFELESITAYLAADNSIWLYEDVNHPGVWYAGKGNEKFLELSEKHQDRNFKGLVLNDQLPKNEYFANDFSDISITSDSDFDTTHPAGTPLDDIARFVTVTPAKFIKSGYTDTFDWKSYDKADVFYGYFHNTMSEPDGYKPGHITLGRENIAPVYKLVKDLTADDMTLLGRGVIQFHQQHGVTDPFAVIEFTEKPESAGVHHISITITTDAGVIYNIKPVSLSFM